MKIMALLPRPSTQSESQRLDLAKIYNHLCQGLMGRNRRVLLVDANPQPLLCNTSELRHSAPIGLTTSLFKGEVSPKAISNYSRTPDGEGILDLLRSVDRGNLPDQRDWIDIERQLTEHPDRLKKLLRQPALRNCYDWLIVDTQHAPPVVQSAAVRAADFVVRPRSDSREMPSNDTTDRLVVLLNPDLKTEKALARSAKLCMLSAPKFVGRGHLEAGMARNHPRFAYVRASDDAAASTNDPELLDIAADVATSPSASRLRWKRAQTLPAGSTFDDLVFVKLVLPDGHTAIFDSSCGPEWLDRCSEWLDHLNSEAQQHLFGPVRVQLPALYQLKSDGQAVLEAFWVSGPTHVRRWIPQSGVESGCAHSCMI